MTALLLPIIAALLALLIVACVLGRADDHRKAAQC